MSIHTHDFDLTDRSAQKILLLQPGRHTDVDGIDDIGADAIGAAREATQHLAELPHEALKPAASHHKFLETAVGKRRVLTEDYRHAAQAMLRHLARIEPSDAYGEHLWKASDALRRSLECSHRVADLLASERDVLWHRTNAR